MYILHRVECVDEVALQALLPWHPSRSAWEVQAGDRRKDWRMVYGLFDVKRRGTESPSVSRQKMRSFGRGLRPWRRREEKEPKEGKAFHPGEKVSWRKSGD